jgi:putative transposase
MQTGSIKTIIMKYNPQKHDRESIRLQGYDYTQTGFYFVTVCTHNREMLFGEINKGVMILNDYGKIIHDEWMKSGKIRNNIKMNTFVVMPNHFHGIIEIISRSVLNTPSLNTPSLNTPSLNTPSLNTPAEIKNDNRAYVNTPLRSPSQTIGSIVRGMKSAMTKQINELRHTPGTKLWQRNYWEHIVWNKNELNRICQYIQNNPQKWDDDKLNNGVGNILMEHVPQYGDEKWMV